MQITLHTPDTIYAPRHVPSWLLLAASSGIVNGMAFLTCEQFVTHITGTITRLGLEGPVVGLVAEYASVVCSFILGAMTAMLLIQGRARPDERPRWATPLISVAIILIGIAIAGHTKLLGRFGYTLAADPPPVVLLSVLAFAMGLQNAAVASTTGLAVRTTHLSGPATDLGIHLGTAILATGKERWAALRGAALRGGKILAFMAGAGLSLPLSAKLGFLTLLIPAAFILCAAMLSFTTNWSPSDFPFRASRDGFRPTSADAR